MLPFGNVGVPFMSEVTVIWIVPVPNESPKLKYVYVPAGASGSNSGVDDDVYVG